MTVSLENSNNSDFWIKKIQRNMQRDREVEVELHGLGWSVLRFWSKDVLRNTDECVKTIEERIFIAGTED